ncbi:gluconokinase [Umezawaea endophytica]|uniref:Gluconokinase n=1 Tax=Umezawaea endophytica TaxID=1654476 RepID=A0A9X2VV29_9PSEU|nr:gluconokinase [Umezawaea endophytica]MCS7483411.1 gluconokinase [Umezawaea endophytica]
MAEAVLGVDLGTTATKVIAVDRSARVLFSAEHGYPLHTTPSGEATHDPLQVVEAAFLALREVAAWCVSSDVDVVALSLTGAMHTLLAVGADGEPLTGSLSWADNRAVEETALLRGTEAGAALHQVTGTPIHPFAPLSKLAWFSRHSPELARSARWCGLKDFVGFRLTGRLATEHSSGSGTGLMDIHRLAWHPESLAFAGIEAAQLPELLAPTDSFPLTADVLGIRPGTPVVMGGGDGPLANLGVGAVVPGVAALSLGTSGALRVVRDQPGVDERGRVFCYGIADGLWVLGGAVSNGGVVAQWAADTFSVEVSVLLEEAAGVPVGANGVLALPYLLAERAPWWDPDPRATLIGLRKEHTRAEITRALVEGVGQQLALVLEAVRSTGAAVDTVRVTGGAFRSELWAVVLASALGMELELADDSEGSGVGAALVGWRALGVLSSLTEAAELVVPGRRILPDAEAVEYYARVLPVVERVYGALRDLKVELGG